MRKIHAKVFGLYALGLIIFLLIRFFFVPPTFGDYGWYRASSVEEIAGLEAKFANSSSCKSCHLEIYTAWKESHHKNVSCESCHGPSLKHVENSEKFGSYLNESRDFCLLCHKLLPSKPGFMPQIREGHANLRPSCLECHDPHARVGE
jgi:hypothetical protein